MKGTHRGQKTEREISDHPSSAPSPEPNRLGLNKQGRRLKRTQEGHFLGKERAMHLYAKRSPTLALRHEEQELRWG